MSGLPLIVNNEFHDPPDAIGMPRPGLKIVKLFSATPLKMSGTRTGRDGPDGPGQGQDGTGRDKTGQDGLGQSGAGRRTGRTRKTRQTDGRTDGGRIPHIRNPGVRVLIRLSARSNYARSPGANKPLH